MLHTRFSSVVSGSARVLRAAAAAATLAAVAVALPLVGAAGNLPQGAAARAPQVAAERQPAADRGDGTYLNPILAGEYPDPSVVRVGRDYYMTNTSGTASPGLLVWHSRDLVNWEPLGPALSTAVGDVWAPDLTYHRGLFYIYFPALVRDQAGKGRRTSFVITAKDPAGPWSAPIDLKVGGIDPGHIADASGNRYLYLDDGMMAPLTPDGLSLAAPPVKVYDGWDYPADWNVECKCLESPKLFARGGYYYLVSAQGGTAGPSTSHMIVVARATSPTGPWQNMPSNPLLRTARRSERWWSQGHGTLVEAVDGTWWVVYHAFENGFRTLGRQTLLMPVEWTADGWPRLPAGADAGAPQKKPAGEVVAAGLALSDTFAPSVPGWQWRRWEARDASADYARRPGDLQVRARGTGPADAALLTVSPVNRSYEVQVEARLGAATQAGLVLHYDAANFDGVGATPRQVLTFLKGQASGHRPRSGDGTRVFFRIRNVEHDVQLFVSEDGVAWQPLGGSDMSGFHHDTFRNWSTLKIGVFAAGDGIVTFRDFRYRGL